VALKKNLFQIPLPFLRIVMIKHQDKIKALVHLVILGQQDDARMNVSIALTAARRGASIANHTEVIRLLKKKIIQGNATGDIGI
jgi:glycerol-3-phosphate dehydrogenase